MASVNVEHDDFHYKAFLMPMQDEDENGEFFYYKLGAQKCRCADPKHRENVQAAHYFPGVFNSDGTCKPKDDWVVKESDGKIAPNEISYGRCR